jgi:uncharacterized UPF0146 family protein
VTPAPGDRAETKNPKKYGYASLYSVGMGDYKHIETCIGEYIAGHYTRAVEIGIGNNTEAAHIIKNAGVFILGTDVKDPGVPAWLPFMIDDIFSPAITLYQGADVIYSIRPAIEMIPPLIALARTVNCDLVVYHLGFESYGMERDMIDCGVLLHRYYRHSEPVKKG